MRTQESHLGRSIPEVAPYPGQELALDAPLYFPDEKSICQFKSEEDNSSIDSSNGAHKSDYTVLSSYSLGELLQ